MQTKMLVKKTEPASGRTNNPVNNNHKNKPAANKKNVRTTDYKKLLQMMLNDPDAITREEFLFLQSIIGYRQAVVAREKAKQRKQQRKIEQTNLVMKQILLERSNSEIKKDSDGKKEASELKNNDEKNPLQMKKGDGNITLSGSSIQHNLRAGLEKISGVDLSDVKVHQNSDKPQQVGALAYTQGNDIHIAPGQEKHLPHEGWHAVQQKQGVVKPTLQMKSGTLVNDDAGLEKEADDMGRIATEEGRSLLNTQQLSSKVTQPQLSEGKIIQRVETKGQTYIVKKGDTLGGIAIKYNVSVDELVKLNKLKNENEIIKVGQALKLPPNAKLNPEVKSEGNTYIVKKGDTLGGIAIKYNVSVDELVKLNKLKNENEIIKVGQALKLPPNAKLNPEVKSEGNTYIVKKGDTLGGIAIKYNVSVDELVKLNKLKNENEIIKVGQALKLPPNAKLNPEVKSEGNTSKDKPEEQRNSSVDNNKKNENSSKETSNSSDTKGTVNDSIISNLRGYEGFGYKKDAMIKAAEALLSEGYEPAFIAGLLSNIKHEGSPGVFEKSNYGSFELLSNDKDKDGRYLKYKDSGNYKKKGAYLIYMDKYMNYSDFSGKTISEVGLDKLNKLLKNMKKTGAQSVVAGKWKDGKFLGYYDKQTSGGFGTGMIQWTFDRAEGLIKYYNTKKFEKDGFPTQEESLETEIEYMIKELKSAGYKGIYGDGKKYDSSNKDAAYLAGYNICKKYEIPSDTEKKAEERGKYAREVYKIMMHGK